MEKTFEVTKDRRNKRKNNKGIEKQGRERKASSVKAYQLETATAWEAQKRGWSATGTGFCGLGIRTESAETKGEDHHALTVQPCGYRTALPGSRRENVPVASQGHDLLGHRGVSTPVTS